MKEIRRWGTQYANKKSPLLIFDGVPLRSRTARFETTKTNGALGLVFTHRRSLCSRWRIGLEHGFAEVNWTRAWTRDDDHDGGDDSECGSRRRRRLAATVSMRTTIDWSQPVLTSRSGELEGELDPEVKETARMSTRRQLSSGLVLQ
ncbi:hypothetical protein Bca52824_010737 [Brassica carinata]|uniref:Uncharacterized protein n=1 Tax=Brassica carinata TaxID=52824 RepID=A0A8X7WE17_BRACI|nr:hypothetical protein Bca52824_010737 [Brassica carinata]